MPKTNITLEKLGGAVLSVDPRDIAETSGSAATDVDFWTTEGTLRGARGAGEQADVSGSVITGDAFVVIAEEGVLLAFDATAGEVYVYSGFPDAPVLEATLSCAAKEGGLQKAGKRAFLFQQEEYLGVIFKAAVSDVRGTITGWMLDQNFSTSDPTGDAFYTATAATAATTGEGLFPDDTTVEYFVSLSFQDGSESSLDPLVENGTLLGNPIIVDTGTGTKEITFTIKLWEYASLPAFVRAVNVYRRERIAGLTSEPVLVEQLDFSSSSWTATTEAHPVTAVVTPVANRDFVDSYEQRGTYAEMTGLAYLNGASSLQARAMCIDGAYAFAVPDLTTGSIGENDLLLRSKAYRYGMYRWEEDYARLPEPIDYIAAFAGRVFAFGNVGTYAVDAQSLALVDTYEGIKVRGRRSILTTDYGLFFVDATEIYLYDGAQLRRVGAPLREQLSDYEGEVVLGFVSGFNLLVVSCGETCYGLSLSLSEASALSVTPTAFVHASDGNLWADVEGLLPLFASDRQPWTWTSKEFAFDDDRFKVYDVAVSHRGTPPVLEIADEWAFLPLPESTSEILSEGRIRTTFSARGDARRTFRFRLSADGDTAVDAVTMTLRRLPTV